ncbi:Sec-independent protein translocase subunit TatA/TatB [Rufibacter roseus]|uniref:Sec-independent protein translocase protein TatA n=1 Tax=Rufibacter roseus TaxID=1567108 RepID=A0ABW2DHD0_9BACT|nr:twin-arginine translocase TatA/TatE family subunit [Rufibacter roseus]
MLSNTLLFIGNLGTGEIIALVLIVVLLFGAKKIPELARGMGRGIREFKDATKEIKHDIENAANEDRPSNTANRTTTNNTTNNTNA